MNKNKWLYIFIAICLVNGLAACSQDMEPEQAAKQFVEGKLNTRNARYTLKADDGVFAIIHVVMETRQSAEHPWHGQEVDVSCKKTGGDWICSMAPNK